MRAYLFLFLILFGFSTGRVLSVSRDCESALQSLFSEEVSKEEAGEFLKLQGDITLHRLAWTYLKAQKKDSDSKVQSVERTIIELLNEKYMNADPKFVKARVAFEAQPLSRTTLADIAPYLKEALSHSYSESDDNFKLNASDLKLLSVLSKHERSSAVSGKYDHRLLDANSPQGILNFVKLVNSSYKISPNQSEQELAIELKLSGLEKVMDGMQKRISGFLNELDLPTVCFENEDCTTDSSMGDFFKQNEDVQNIFWESLAEELQNDDILLEKMSYGDLWLKVKTGKLSSVSAVVTKKESSSPKPRKHRTTPKPFSPRLPQKEPRLKPLPPSVVQEAGLLTEDPQALIQKDKPGRSKDEFASSDKKFQTAMAEAILKNESAFIFEGKIFDRKTGKELKYEEVLKLLPKKEQEKLLLSPQDKKHSILVATLNMKQTFIQGNELYGLDGKHLVPAVVISQELGQKLGLTVEPGRFRNQSYGLLVTRAHALRNNLPYFVYENRTYDSLSGNDASSPFRGVASLPTKMEKSKRRILENLSDKELIKSFHREYPNANCGYYGVLDKPNAELKIYANDGKEVYQSEVLIGAEKSDQRTRWTEYSKTERVSSSSTGAGIFTIRPQMMNDEFNRKNFNNNILSFNDEANQNTVFALHQVPVNMKNRYNRFGTNDPEDRRISGGCANLKLSDFLAIKKWLGPACKVYVLPEEKGNKFIISDNALKFVSSAPVAASKTNLYNFSSLDAKPRRISIRIHNKAGNTQIAREFAKALEDEKPRLMKLYKLTNDEYNDLALLSYGILGNESSFGTSKRLSLKEYTLGGLQLGQVGVVLGKLVKGNEDAFNTSRGFTQIKNLPEGDFTKTYPEINKDNLVNPRNAAVATMGYLAEAANTMRKIAIENQSDPAKLRITRENMMDYMSYLYQGGAKKLKATDPGKQATPEYNAYYRSLQRHMSFVEITQKIE